MNLTGPACTQTMSGAEEARIQREQKTIQAGSELSGRLGTLHGHKFGFREIINDCEVRHFGKIDSGF